MNGRFTLPIRPDGAGSYREGRTAGEAITAVRREAALLEIGPLQEAILNSASFSSIATDDKGVIQLFNVGAERRLRYTAADVLNKITPADIADPQKPVAQALAGSGLR